MLSLLCNRFKKDIWVTYLEEDMKQIEARYIPYGVYFQKLGTIRHDFANYVQSVQFFWMDEEAAKEGKNMKLHIIGLIDELEDALINEMERISIQKINYDRCPSFQDYEKMDVLLSKRWKSWFPKKKYYAAMDKEIPRMFHVLSDIREKLTYSLDPDERECEEMLRQLDSFKNQINVDDPVLAALISDVNDDCKECGIDFKYRAELPDTFEISIVDVYHIYECLLAFALGQTKHYRGEEASIRFKTASQYELWHLQLECPPGIPKLDRAFMRLLKKNKITYKYKCVDGRTQIDLIR